MISVKTKKEIELMREAGRISALALEIGGKAAHPGVTTKHLDDLMRRCILQNGAKPSFLGIDGYPAASCISINDEIVHTIPSSRILKEGDIVGIDVGACWGGFHGDNAKTFPCGVISSEAQKLVNVTRESLKKAISLVTPGLHVGDIGAVIQEFVEANGFSVVHKFVGHGIGRDVHEDPRVPNYGKKGHGECLHEGMVIAIEPMVNAGSEDVRVRDDGSAVTLDGSLSAHFEHTVAILNGSAVVLTDPGG
jgi:methionyl aminopeptidase